MRRRLTALLALAALACAGAVAASSAGGERTAAAHIPGIPVVARTTTSRCPIPARFRPAFTEAATETSLPLALLTAVAQVESRFQPRALSQAGAQGLFQVMPTTAAELQLDARDTSSNVLAGARRLVRSRACGVQRRPDRGREVRRRADARDRHVRRERRRCLAPAAGVRVRYAWLAAAAVLLAGCGGAKHTTTTTTQAAATTQSSAHACAKATPHQHPNGGYKNTHLKLDPAKTYKLVFHTNCGDFTVTLDQKSAPNAVSSLVSLAKRGFFNDTFFHRIVPGFVIQGGDPTGT